MATRASNFAIKTPFIIEGMILGIIGSILPICLILFGYPMLYDRLGGHVFSPLIKMIEPTNSFIWKTSVLVLIIGIIVGMIGSARAVRKYLKV